MTFAIDVASSTPGIEATIDAASGEITYKPATAGNKKLVVTAKSAGGVASLPKTIYLDTQANAAPVWAPMSTTLTYNKSTQNQKQGIAVAASDPNNDVVTIAKKGLWPDWIDFANGQITIDVPGVPALDVDVLKSITLSASDNAVPVASTDLTFLVSVLSSADSSAIVVDVDAAGKSVFYTGHAYTLVATASRRPVSFAIDAATSTAGIEATIDATTGEIAYKPTTVGSKKLAVVAQSADGTSSQPKVIYLDTQANGAPVWAPVSTTLMYYKSTQNQKQGIAVSASDPNNDVVTILRKGTWPAWLGFADGQITVDVPNVPTADMDAAKSFTLTASDNASPVASTDLTFSVAIVSTTATRPVMAGVDGELASYVTQHSYTLYAHAGDAVAGELTYEYDRTEAAGATGTTAGVITFLPVSAGTQTLKVRAKNARGALSDWYTVRFASVANHVPVLAVGGSTIQNLGSRAGATTIPVSATDSDGDVVTLSLVGTVPSWITFAGGIVRIEPSAASAAELNTTIQFSIRANDGYTGTASVAFTVTVDTSTPVWSAVPLAGIPAHPATSHTYNMQLAASSSVDNALTYEKDTTTVGADCFTVVSATGAVIYTPTTVRTDVLKVRAKDKYNRYTDWLSVSFVVVANIGPTITSTLGSSITLSKNSGLQSFRLTTSDPENDTVTLSLAAGSGTLPSWITLVGNLLSINAAAVTGTEIGATFEIVVSASDGFTATTYPISVVVNANPFNVVSVAYPQTILAGRTYPVDGLSVAGGSIDLAINRFVALCDADVQSDETLQWSFIYNGATTHTVTGAPGSKTIEFNGADSITIPLADSGVERYFTVQVTYKGLTARSNNYVVRPIGNTLPMWSGASLVSTQFKRDINGTFNNGGNPTGVFPVVNVTLTPVPATTGTGVPMRFTVTAVDANYDPVTFVNARVVDAAAPTTTLDGTLVKIGTETFDGATGLSTATFEFTPAFASVTLVPRFLVDFHDWSGASDALKRRTDQAINAFDAGDNVLGAVRLNYPMEIVAAYDETSVAAANKVCMVSGAGALLATNLDPRAVKAEEGTINYGVKIASGSYATSNGSGNPAALTNVLIRDNLDISSLDGSYFNHDYLYAQSGSGQTAGGTVTEVTTDPVLYGAGTASASLTQNRSGQVKTSGPAWDADGSYEINWTAAHQDVRTPVTFSVNVTDVWGNQGPGYSWVGQMSSMVRPVKTDTKYAKSSATAFAGTTVAWPATNAWTIQPYNRKAQADATTIASAENLKWASWGVGPGTWGNMGRFVGEGTYVPGDGENGTTELGTTAWAGKVVSAGNLSSQIDAGNALPGVVAAGRYGVTLTPAAVVYERLFTNFRMDGDITDGMNLGMTIHGRDMHQASAVAASPSANTGFTVSHLEGLRPWLPGSVLQFHNDNVSFGNIVLQHGDDSQAAYAAVSPVTATSKSVWSFPFPGLTGRNLYPTGRVAGGRFYLGTAYADDAAGTKPTPSTGTTTNMQILLSGLSVPDVALTAGGALFDNKAADRLYDGLYLVQLDQTAGPSGLPVAAANRAVAPNNDMVSADGLGTLVVNNIDFTGSGLTNASNSPSDLAPTGGNPGVTMVTDTWNPSIDRGAFYTALLTAGGTNMDATPVSYLETRNGFLGGATSKASREQFALFATPSGLVRNFEQHSPMMILAQDFYRTSNATAGWAVSTSQTTDLGTFTFYHPFSTYTKLAEYVMQAGIQIAPTVAGGTAILPHAAPFSWSTDYGFYANIVAVGNTSGATLAPVMAPVQNVRFSYTVAAATPSNYVDYVSYDISNKTNLVGAGSTTFQAAALDVDTIRATTHGGGIANTLAGQSVAVPAVKVGWTVPTAFAADYSGAEIELWAYPHAVSTFAAAPAATLNSIDDAGAPNAKPGLYKTYTVGKSYTDVRIPVADITPGGGKFVDVYFRIRAFAMKNTDGTVADLGMNPLARTMPGTNGTFGYAEFVTQPFTLTK